MGEEIIIKKIKKGGHGHHGGAWKVAYADFVTAMMAFFLLMWLLGLASEEQLQGLADYFTPSEGVIGETGSYFGTGPNPDAFEDFIGSQKVGGSDIALTAPANRHAEGGMSEDELKSLSKQLKDQVKKDDEISKYEKNIMVEQTSDGLLIQIVSSDDDPPLELFKFGKAELSDDAKKILKHIMKMIYYIPNYISITGHTDSSPLRKKNHDYTNWELSADRANAARRFLIESGLERDQIARVIGKSSVEPLILENPRDIRNRRIGITLLKPEIFMPVNKQNTPDDFFKNK